MLEEFSTSVTVENIYFSDHDPVRIVIEKNVVDFHTTPIWLGNKEKFDGFAGFLVILIHLSQNGHTKG